MVRRKRATRNNRNDSVISISSANSTLVSVGESVNSTVTSIDLNESNTNSWYADFEEKVQAEIRGTEQVTAAAIEQLELIYQTILLTIPKNLLNKPVSLDDERIWEAFADLNSVNEDLDTSQGPSPDSPVAPTTVKRRRSRSVKEGEFLKPEVPKDMGLRRTTRIRSSSVDAYQTPKNKVRLSVLTTAKKYTVSKPKKAEDSGINMKRFMKPDEEAISTSGSPLYVHSGLTSTPHVNIPLPGGVVMSIEPKRPRGRLDVPELDEQTKKQIKILCEQLKNIADS